MTTARERYEKKTKVITFRVNLEVYAELEEIRAKGGLSYSDLIKAGAGIARQEIAAKLAQISGLQDRLAELSAAVERKQQELDQFVNEERARRLKQLDTEMAAFKLFDRRWSTEQVSLKLSIAQEEVLCYLQEWAQERKEKRVLERELLRACLKKHIEILQQRMSFAHLLPSTSQETLQELERLIKNCQRLLSAPSRISKADREFLLAEYSARILPKRGSTP